jgi:phosphogluconate dehydratase
MNLLVDATLLEQRKIAPVDLSGNQHGFGRELFAAVRQNVGSAENGSSIFDLPGEERA